MKHNKCNCSPKINSYIDLSRIHSIPWASADKLLALTNCGDVLVVDKPEFELTEEDRDKLDILVIDGDGTKYLNDAGEYVEIPFSYILLQGADSPANFVILNQENILKITQQIQLGFEPNVRLNLDGYIIPLNVEFKSNYTELVLSYDKIYEETMLRTVYNRLRVYISLNTSIYPNTVNHYEVRTFTDSSEVVISNGDGNSALFNDGTYKEVLTAENTATKTELQEVKDELTTAIDTVQDNLDYVGTVLQGNIDATNVRIDNLDTRIDGIDSNISDLNDALLQEVQDRIAGDTNLQNQIDDLDTKVDANYAEQQAFQTTTNNAFNTVNNTINDLDGRVNQNEINIGINSTDIDELRDMLNNQDHFRGSYNTSAEIPMIDNPQNGDYAYSLESGTIWNYTTTGTPLGWSDSGVAIPSGVYALSDDTPLSDTPTGSAGTATTISRSDHRHIADANKANVTDLDNYLALSGNTQTNQMTGDIWLGSANQINLSDSGNSSIGLNQVAGGVEVKAGGAAGIDLQPALGTAKYNGVEIATVDDVNNLETSVDATYLKKAGDTMTGQLTMSNSDIMLDQEHFIGFYGDGRVRIGYNTAAQELRISTTSTDNGIDVVTNPSVSTSLFKYNGDEVATKVFVTDTITTSLSNYYTKAEVDAIVAEIEVDLTDYYTKLEVDGLLSAKANVASTYTKTEVDNLVAPKANSADVYTKSETYTKSEVDDLIDNVEVDLDGYVKNGENSVALNVSTSALNPITIRNRFDANMIELDETSNVASINVKSGNIINQAQNNIYITTNLEGNPSGKALYNKGISPTEHYELATMGSADILEARGQLPDGTDFNQLNSSYFGVWSTQLQTPPIVDNGYLNAPSESAMVVVVSRFTGDNTINITCYTLNADSDNDVYSTKVYTKTYNNSPAVRALPWKRLAFIEEVEDAKPEVFLQSTEPTEFKDGDIWIQP